jgi:cytochrome c peroxidase
MIFFGKGKCVECHSVSDPSNEMFSDFKRHVIGVPQIAPSVGNVVFDGPGQNEDFGLEQITGDPNDRYMFRTSPLRNVGLQPAFFHNGCFTRLEDAVRHHLNVFASARGYNPVRAGVASDLSIMPLGPIEPVLARVDPLLATPIQLTEDEFGWLVDFVRNGLLDDGIRPQHFRNLVPKSVPSGRATLTFEFEKGLESN